MSNPADLVYTIAKDKLPAEWSLATISDLVGKDGVFVDGDWVESKDQDPDGDVRLIQLADIGDGEYRNRSERFLTHEKAIQLGCTFLEKGDVLIARMPDPLGRACIFPGDQKKSVTVVDVAIVRPAGNAFDARWLMYFVNAPAFRSAVSSMQSGSTRKRISRGNLSKIVLPVPPLDQQKRIVAEIEKQFSRLDEAVANLKRVKANLKRYKAAVLKAAVEGRLVETEAERARRDGRSYETGAQLLQRILETHRSQWQGKGKYKEPAAPDTTNLPELPEGWVWASLGALLVGIEAGKSFKCEERPPTKDEVGVVKVSAVTWGEFDESESKTCLDKRLVNDKLLVQHGDFLFSRANTIELVGACVIAKKVTSKVMLSDKILRFQLLSGMEQWVLYNLRSTFGREEIERLATGNQESMRNIGQDRIRAIRIPLPPPGECRRIVLDIERRLSLVGETEAQTDTNLKRAERLRQAVLQQDFVGRLPMDIPAEGAVRVERISA